MTSAEWIGIASLAVALATLVVTCLVLKWTGQWKARWQLVCIVAPELDTGIKDGALSQLILVFENVGGSTATAAHAWFTGITDKEDKYLVPASGSRSVPVGDVMTVSWSFAKLASKPEWADFKQFTHGDDVYFDLKKLEVTFYWGPAGKRKQTITDLHHKQSKVPYLSLSTAPESLRQRLASS